MSYFLGMEVKQRKYEVFICHKKYAKKILRKFLVENYKVTTSPMNHKEKFNKNDWENKIDEDRYRSLIGCLMYLIATQLDKVHAVSLL